MGIPIVYRKTRPSTINSFDFIESITGRGYISFTPFESNDSVGTKYHLSGDVVRSKNIEHDAVTSSGTTDSEVDYDSGKLSKGVAILGDAYVIGSFGATMGVGATSNDRLDFTLSKYDGTTETVIATASTQTFATTASINTNTNYITKIAIANPADIKVGEIIRLSINQHIVQTGGAISTHYYGIDPSNRASANISPSSTDRVSQLKFLCPFKIIR